MMTTGTFRLSWVGSLAVLVATSCSSPEQRNEKELHSSAEVTDLIERGRVLLDAGAPKEAQPLFEEAARAENDSLRTRMWVLRSWMDQGRNNDTLDALDALDRAGENGPEMTYLYGMAFARRAEGHLAAGVTDSSIEINFLDAASNLKLAVDTDGARFRDAYLPLSRSAWFTQDLELARWSAERAVELYPDQPEARLALGRSALSQFVGAVKEAPESTEAEAHWTAASDAFARAVALFGEPRDAEDAKLLSEAALELGHTLLWKQRTDEAAEAYATAIAWSPETVDYGELRRILGSPASFSAALEKGLARFQARTGADDAQDSSLLWWLGWTRFEAQDWVGAEEAYRASLAKRPGSASSWLYVALCRQKQDDREGALTALQTGWDLDPPAMISAAAAGNVFALESLIGWCVEEDRMLDAALVAEICAEASPQEARHWNNLGLFLRDEGENLEIEAHDNQQSVYPPDMLEDLYRRAFRAYARAIELVPDDPQLLNDTAVLLHYHLDEYDTALTMYARSIELAEKILADPALPPVERERFETSLDDAKKNQTALLEYLERRRPAGAFDTALDRSE